MTKIKVENPTVEIPQNIVVGDFVHHIDFIRRVLYALADGNSLRQAAKNVALVTKINLDEKGVNNLRYLLYRALGKNVSAIEGTSKEEIENKLCEMQRYEVVINLKKDNWRESAIAKEVNRLFATLPNLSVEDIQKIRVSIGGWKAYKDKRKNLVPGIERAVHISEKNIDKNKTYTLTITGPNLEYRQFISKNKVVMLIKANLEEK